MQNQTKLKTTSMSMAINNQSETLSQQGIRTLTSEEILAVAGGPEVDIETGTGG